MNNDELRQLERDLAAAFPNWFKTEYPLFNTHIFASWRPLSNGWAYGEDALFCTCLDAANSRGWQPRLALFKNGNYCVWVDRRGWGIGCAERETPAIAAALAILEAHRKEQAK